MKQIATKFALVMVLLAGIHVSATAQSGVQRNNYQCTGKTMQVFLYEMGELFKVPISSDPLMLKECKLVTLVVKNATLEEILTLACANQPVVFEFAAGKYFMRVRLPVPAAKPGDSIVSKKICGRVVDAFKQPISGATIAVHTKFITQSDAQGYFCISTCSDVQKVTVSYVGYAAREISLGLTIPPDIVLTPAESVEQSVQVAFIRAKPGTTLMPVDHIEGQTWPYTPTDIASQLAGRSAGLWVQYTNGSHSSAARLQIRNNGWIDFPGGSEPLVVLDHTYLPPSYINQLEHQGGNPNATGGARGGFSLWRVVSPDEVESVEILKDGSGSALFGSKGANGVIIINTQKARPGQPAVNATWRSGTGITRNRFELLETAPYLAARAKGYALDKVSIDSVKPPDLTTYNNGRYTDFVKEFLGQPAVLSHANLTYSEYTATTNYRVSATYDKETAVLPGKKMNRTLYDQDIFLKANWQRMAFNKRFIVDFDGLYFDGVTHSIAADMAPAVRLFPNAPPLLNDAKQLIWYPDFTNPFVLMMQPYTGNTRFGLAHLGVSWTLLPGLILRGSGGFNRLELQEHAATPAAAQDPSTQPVGNASFAISKLRNWLLEGVADYSFHNGGVATQLLLGATIIDQKDNRNLLQGWNYNSDLSLNSPQAAGILTAYNTVRESGYRGIFLRANTVITEQWMIDATLRQDASSRFGPDNRYAWFWGAGGGWIITHSYKIPHISYARLRASYGTSGNDAIGDYQFQEIYAQVPAQNAGAATYQAIRHQNKDYGWGKSRKLEIGAEVSIDSLFTISTALYRNITTNQLINQAMPAFTGFGSMRANVDARVEGQGIEVQVQKKAIRSKGLRWNCILNISFQQNRLLSLPGAAYTIYQQQYSLNKSLTMQRGLVYLGPNTLTGAADFLDVNNDNNFDTADYKDIGHLDPKVFGGFQHTFRYKSVTLDIGWEFAILNGYNYLLQFYPMNFGNGKDGFSNVPAPLLDQWQAPGKSGAYPVWSASSSEKSKIQYQRMRNSSLQVMDASYLRLKNLCIAYALNTFKAGKKAAIQTTFFCSADNVLLLTGYKGADPNAQNFSGIPLLKKYCLGARLTIK